MASSQSAPRRLFILRPSMGQGGAEQVTLKLLQGLNRQRFLPALILMQRKGAFLDEIPADIQILALNARSLWTAWWSLAGLLRRERPDILFSPGGSDIAAIIAHRLARSRARLILSERNRLIHTRLTAKRRLMIWLKRTLFPYADQLTAVSEGVKQDMVRRLKLHPDSITVLYNPIVDEGLERMAAEPIDHPWFQEDIPIILSAGRLVAQKDFGTLIRAVAKVAQERQVRLVILGEGPLRTQLQMLAQKVGLEDQFCLPGFDKNPFRYMANCAVFVLPSLHEGLPGVLIQAMACGAAVIATDCEYGSAEIITQSGTDGWLVPVADVDALANRLRELLDDPQSRAQMGQNARLSAQRFSGDAQLARYESVLLDEAVDG